MFKRFWWVFLVTGWIGHFLGGVVAAVITLKIPKIFESRAIVELVNHTNDKSLTSPLMVSGELKSRENLEIISEYLSLESRWELGREEVLSKLDAAVTVNEGDAPDRLEILARHNLKFDARNIAMAMGAYCLVLFEPTKPDVKKLREMIEDQKLSNSLHLKRFEARKREVGDNLQYLESLVDQEKGLLADEEELAELEKRLEDELKNPTVVPVVARLLESPAISDVPVYPDVDYNLNFGRVSGLLVSPFLAIIPIWLLRRRVPSSVENVPLESDF